MTKYLLALGMVICTAALVPTELSAQTQNQIDIMLAAYTAKADCTDQRNYVYTEEEQHDAEDARDEAWDWRDACIDPGFATEQQLAVGQGVFDGGTSLMNTAAELYCAGDFNYSLGEDHLANGDAEWIAGNFLAATIQYNAAKDDFEYAEAVYTETINYYVQAKWAYQNASTEWQILFDILFQ